MGYDHLFLNKGAERGETELYSNVWPLKRQRLFLLVKLPNEYPVLVFIWRLKSIGSKIFWSLYLKIIEDTK